MRNQRRIKESKAIKIVDFWCKECGRDFKANGVRVIKTYEREDPRAIYMANCPVEHLCIRHITDIELDPYFRLSKNVRQSRHKYAKDVLQPGQDGYTMYYGEEKDRREA